MSKRECGLYLGEALLDKFDPACEEDLRTRSLSPAFGSLARASPLRTLAPMCASSNSMWQSRSGSRESLGILPRCDWSGQQEGLFYPPRAALRSWVLQDGLVQEEQKKSWRGACATRWRVRQRMGKNRRRDASALAIKDQALANRFLGRRDREGIDLWSNSGSRCWNVQEGACF